MSAASTLLALLAVAAPLSAQAPDTAARRVQVPDTLRRLKPISAFWRSLLIPGWGQAATERWVTGAAFVAWEGTCAMMTLKARSELRYLREIGAGHVDGKSQEAQDWLTLWIFNHLFAGAEAFVSAHLQDFPTDLRIRAVPGGVGVSFSLPR
jgi:hypothetical protein